LLTAQITGLSITPSGNLKNIIRTIIKQLLAAGCEELTDPAGSRHSDGGFASSALAHGPITRTTPFVYLLGFSVLVLL
jgi:hypothetical protein